MPQLDGKKVAIIVHDYFEQVELTSPKEALEAAGAMVHIVSPEKTVHGLHHVEPGDSFITDMPLTQANADDYDALVIPGGVVNADQLRVLREAQEFIKQCVADEKPVAVICHGPWLLVSAGLAKGCTLTSYPTLADDIRNAGGTWVDQQVAIDGPIITSRNPGDLDAFNQTLIDRLT